VQSAALVNHLPIAGDTWRSPFTVEARPAVACALPALRAARVDPMAALRED
jgi:ABC-type lipoprotein release transport system permease subunit